MTIRPAHLRAALAGLLIVLVVPLAGCAGEAPDSAAATAGWGSTAAAGSATSPGAPETSPATAEQRIEVTVAHGRVSGDTGRVAVAAGTAVTLVVTSAESDRVHVHGYDIEQELTPGTPATLQFQATVPGVFEVELHHAETVLLRLQVS